MIVRTAISLEVEPDIVKDFDHFIGYIYIFRVSSTQCATKKIRKTHEEVPSPGQAGSIFDQSARLNLASARRL